MRRKILAIGVIALANMYGLIFASPFLFKASFDASSLYPLNERKFERESDNFCTLGTSGRYIGDDL